MLTMTAALAWLVPREDVAVFQRERRRGESAPGTSAPRERRGDMDTTFIVTADTHFGHPRMAELNAQAIAAMKAMPGRAFPSVVGGTVGRPRGLLAAGDLTEGGAPEQWDAFVEHYVAGLPFSVFETWGNHDKNHGWYVRHRIEDRHGGVVYSFDWHDLHIVSLGEAPDHDDVEWLRQDLAGAGTEVGVVIFFHFPLSGPYTDNWFTADHKAALAEALAGYRVLGIFHGHYHAAGMDRWHGFDVYNVGSPKHGFTSFAVVRVTDERMTVASWNYRRSRWWWWHHKPVFGAGGSALRHVPRGLVGGGPRSQ